jgi:hypothetical protein
VVAVVVVEAVDLHWEALDETLKWELRREVAMIVPLVIREET